MKRIICFVLMIGSFGLTSGQIDFTKYVDKKSFKKRNMHSNFECISGDCKNGLGVIKASDMYIIGNFESNQLNGEATILYLQDGWRTYNLKRINPENDLRAHFEKETINEKVYTYYQKYASGVREAFWGEFKDNKLDSGLYTFNGRFEDVQYNRHRLIDIPLTHFYNVMGKEGNTFFTDEKKLIQYSFRGSFSPEYGGENLAFNLKTKDDYFEIKTNWGNDVIIRKHHIPEYFEVTHYNSKSEIIKEVLTHHNTLGTIGWIKEFLPGFNTPYVSMVGHGGVVLYQETIENIGLLPQAGTPYKNGIFYGKMTNGKPDNYGVYIDEYILYDGFFNENGEFDGYGYLTQRKNYPQQSWVRYYPNDSELMEIIDGNGIAVVGYFMGIFEDGVFKLGESGDFNSEIKSSGNMKNLSPLNLAYTTKNYVLNGEGSKFKNCKNCYFVKDHKFIKVELIEQGTFADDLLHGKGFRNGDYGEFVNGEMTEESKKLAAAVYAQKRKEEITSTLANAKFPLGSVVKDQYGSLKYVNELFTNGSVDLVNIPLEVPDYRKKDKSWDKYSIIYESSAYALHARPNFSTQYYTGTKASESELSKYSLTNFKLCSQCKGRANFLVKEETAGTTATTTTTYQRTYEGVFYDTYGNVTTTTTSPTTIVNWVKRNCQTCNGVGCF